MAQSEEQLIGAAKTAARKEIAAQYELNLKMEFVDVRVGKGDGDGLLSLVCGHWRDIGLADEAPPRKFLYMGVDKSVIMPIDDETIASVTDPAELKEYKDAQKSCEEIWQESCQ